MRAPVHYLREEKGASSAEFALVVIPFLVMVFAIIGVSLMFYANHTLQYAAEAAARCYAVDAGNCSTPGAAQTYATSHYTGPAISPVFVASATGCGHTVTGTGSLTLDVIVFSQTIPLSASACYP